MKTNEQISRNVVKASIRANFAHYSREFIQEMLDEYMYCYPELDNKIEYATIMLEEFTNNLNEIINKGE